MYTHPHVHQLSPGMALTNAHVHFSLLPPYQGSMWDVLDVAKAGDPRNPYAKSKPSEIPRGDSPQPDGTARACPNRPPDACVDQPHPYERFTDHTKARGKAVSKTFSTLLADLPLFQGVSAGVQPVETSSYPWPHENLHPSDCSADGAGGVTSDAQDEKDYSMLPDNTTANRITKFHNFCKEVPDVMCNYCSITLYPEDVKWVTIQTPDNGVPSACRASAANAHLGE